MGIGILSLSDDGEELVRGTVSLRKSGQATDNLVLCPVPTTDRGDPLNWPRWRKEVFYGTVLLCTAGMGTNGTLFVPAFQTLADELETSLSSISQLNGATVLCLGVSSYLGGVFIPLYGRRCFMFGSLLAISCGSVWAATSQSYWSLYGARLLQGLGMGSYASLGNTLIKDVFFLHERGTRIAFWQLSWILSINATPMISSRIISAAGWRAAFLAQLGYFALCLAIFLLAGWETLVVRSINDTGHATTNEETSGPAEDIEKSAQTDAVVASPRIISRRRSPYALWHGRFPTPFSWRDLIKPAAMLLTAPVAWCTVTYSFLFSVLIVDSSVFSQVFAAPPYNLGINAIGLISGVGPLIGALIGTAGSGLTADRLVQYLSAKNGNRFEPEMFLLYMAPAALLSLAGHVMWGISVHRAMPIIVPAIGVTIAQAGLAVGICGTIMYASTVLPMDNTDPMSIIMLIRSAFAFGCLFFVNTWLETRGPLEFFTILGCICFALSALAVPLYVWGLRVRFWTENRLPSSLSARQQHHAQNSTGGDASCLRSESRTAR